MKGIIFNLLEEVVTRHHGAGTWDELLDAAGLDGAYTSLGSYPDAHANQLVAAASRALRIPAEEVLRWFGREAMPLLAQRYPAFFTAHTALRPFLLSLNSIIHPEVRKIHPGADVPVFDFADAPDGALLMGYASARKLCALAQGFVEGAAGHYGQPIVFDHMRCMHKGDAKCLFRIAEAPSAAAA
jgi:hypothetical protein